MYVLKTDLILHSLHQERVPVSVAALVWAGGGDVSAFEVELEEQSDLINERFLCATWATSLTAIVVSLLFISKGPDPIPLQVQETSRWQPCQG